MKPMDVWTALNKIGARLGIGSASRRKWRQRGMPAKWRLAIAAEANKDGLVLDFAALGRRFNRPKPRSKRAS